MKMSFRKILIVLLAPVLMVPLFCFTSCKVDFRSDSEVYTCYYYAVDGVDQTDGIISYTLELRTDGKLITRYKTKKNSDSGKDDYKIQGNFLVIPMTSGNKHYDIAANEIIISEYLEKKTHLLAKFRLTSTAKGYTDTVYSCTSRKIGDTETAGDYRYYLVSFGLAGEFQMLYRTASERIVINGTYTESEGGFYATEIVDTEGETLARQWFFETTEDGLTLLETIEDTEEAVIVSEFVLTYAPEVLPQ